MAESFDMKLPSGDNHWTSLMVSQHWFRWWIGAVRQQAITWANVDPDFCRHMASLGHLIRIYQNGGNIKENMSKFVISTVSADGLVYLSDKAFSVPVKTRERLG